MWISKRYPRRLMWFAPEQWSFSIGTKCQIEGKWVVGCLRALYWAHRYGNSHTMPAFALVNLHLLTFWSTWVQCSTTKFLSVGRNGEQTASDHKTGILPQNAHATPTGLAVTARHLGFCQPISCRRRSVELLSLDRENRLYHLPIDSDAHLRNEPQSWGTSEAHTAGAVQMPLMHFWSSSWLSSYAAVGFSG